MRFCVGWTVRCHAGSHALHRKQGWVQTESSLMFLTTPEHTKQLHMLSSDCSAKHALFTNYQLISKTQEEVTKSSLEPLRSHINREQNVFEKESVSQTHISNTLGLTKCWGMPRTQTFNKRKLALWHSTSMRRYLETTQTRKWRLSALQLLQREAKKSNIYWRASTETCCFCTGCSLVWNMKEHMLTTCL